MSRAFVFWYVAGQYERAYGRKIARRTVRDASNPFLLPDMEFQQLYRFTKDVVHYLIEELTPELTPDNSLGCPPYVQVLSAIRFLAVGSYQRGIGQDHMICIAQTTVSKYLLKFTNAVLTRLMHRWIAFPGTASGRAAIASGFQEKYEIPNILGCIDCTHIGLFPPSDNAEQYLNRKGFHSINVQVVSDVNCKIINVVARYPGRIHDQFIFNYSNLKNELFRLYRQRIGDFYLIGDSGYALEPWLMTPILDTEEGSREHNYTKKHCQIRNCVERLFGYLKGTFRCLRGDRILHYSPQRVSEIVYTCCVLYNILSYYRSPLTSLDENNNNDPDDEMYNEYTPPAHLLREAEAKRTRLIQTYSN